jgi:hypothetical protein
LFLLDFLKIFFFVGCQISPKNPSIDLSKIEGVKMYTIKGAYADALIAPTADIVDRLVPLYNFKG